MCSYMDVNRVFDPQYYHLSSLSFFIVESEVPSVDDTSPEQPLTPKTLS